MTTSTYNIVIREDPNLVKRYQPGTTRPHSLRSIRLQQHLVNY